jgi:site-specific recombinase XerD
LALEGVPIEVIAEILGHRSLETTRRYIHYTTAHMWAHVERTARRYLAL